MSLGRPADNRHNFGEHGLVVYIKCFTGFDS